MSELLNVCTTALTHAGLAWNDVSTGAAQSLAYTAAWEGMTLLKNDGTLPLSSKKSVAMIGPWANATTQMQGNYQGIAPYLMSPLMAAHAEFSSVHYAMGTAINTTNTTGYPAAISAAKAADVIVFAGGIDVSIESEGHDRPSIVWPQGQLDLIQQLSELGKPLVVVSSNARDHPNDVADSVGRSNSAAVRSTTLRC